MNRGFALMTPLHAIARGFFETFVEHLAMKPGGIVGMTAVLPQVQAAIGEAKADIDLAYLLPEKISAYLWMTSAAVPRYGRLAGV